MCSCGKDHAGEGARKRYSRNFTDPWRKTPGRVIGTSFVRFYQVTLSSLIGNSCRHLPTCSEYAYEAIARHGLWSGGWMGLFASCVADRSEPMVSIRCRKHSPAISNGICPGGIGAARHLRARCAYQKRLSVSRNIRSCEF